MLPCHAFGRFYGPALAALLVLPAAVAGCDKAAPVPPIELTWRPVTLPAAGGSAQLHELAACGGRWYAVGATAPGPPASAAAGQPTRPAAWTTMDGTAWTPVTLVATRPYGDQGALTSVACRGADVVAISSASGGAHGNPRVSTWRSRPDGAWVQQDAAFELFGGANAGSVDRVVAGPAGWLIVGHRVSPTTKLRGAAVWRSTDGVAFQLVDDDPALRSAGDTYTTAYDAAPGSTGGWVVVGSAGSATSPVPAAWTSPDGSTWQRAGVATIGSGAVERAIRYPGWGLLALGRDVGANLAYAWRAADDAPDTLAELGSTCSGRPDPAGDLLAGLTLADTAAGASAFAAVGTGDRSTVCVSGNGASWRALRPPAGLAGDERLRLAGSGRTLLAATPDHLWIADLAGIRP
ncbi:MAG TPA: hypothetical protein VFE14_17805 [Micromonosporaceae bacterium]|nr:hypothetical protein [Micromonosporaceae bacterium]